MGKCSYAIKYKAKFPPRCLCDLCHLKWEIAQAMTIIADRPDMGGLNADGVIKYKNKLANRSKSLLNNIESLNNEGKQ